MALVESLLTAIVRADGDALVMHVGEKPYVVAPAGPIELSTHGLNLQAMAGMVAQLLPAELQRALSEFGAVEHELPSRPAMKGDRFTVVVARGGDDVWIEIRRHRRPLTAASPVAEARAAAEASTSAVPAPPQHAVTEPPVAVAEGADETPLTSAAPVTTEAPLYADAGEPDDVSDVVEQVVVQKEEVRDAATTEPDLRTLPDFPQEREPTMTPQAAAEHVPSVEAIHAGHRQHAGEPQHREARDVPFEPAEVPPPATAHSINAPLRASRPPESPTTRTPHTVVASGSSDAPAAADSSIARILSTAVARGATALYLTSQASPSVRIDDEVRIIEAESPMSAADVESALLELLPETLHDAARRGVAVEWVSEFAGIGRVRCSTFHDYRGPGAIFQLISLRPRSAESLGLSSAVQALASESEGLILLAAPRGHGTTTLAGALVDLVNRTRAGYVITLESQIRIVHGHQRALISQREVDGSPEDMLTAARAALRENPDVLVVEGLPSAEMCELALDASGSGLLVVATLTAPSATAALSRVIEMFPMAQRSSAQLLLADRLRGAISQVLLRRPGGGRVPAREVILPTAAVMSVLANGAWQDLPRAIASGQKHGLTLLNDALVETVRSGVVDMREAYRRADDRAALLDALKRENIDTSFVEQVP